MRRKEQEEVGVHLVEKQQEMDEACEEGEDYQEGEEDEEDEDADEGGAVQTTADVTVTTSKVSRGGGAKMSKVMLNEEMIAQCEPFLL